MRAGRRQADGVPGLIDANLGARHHRHARQRRPIARHLDARAHDRGTHHARAPRPAPVDLEAAVYLVGRLGREDAAGENRVGVRAVDLRIGLGRQCREIGRRDAKARDPAGRGVSSRDILDQLAELRGGLVVAAKAGRHEGAIDADLLQLAHHVEGDVAQLGELGPAGTDHVENASIKRVTGLIRRQLGKIGHWVLSFD